MGKLKKKLGIKHPYVKGSQGFTNNGFACIYIYMHQYNVHVVLL